MITLVTGLPGSGKTLFTLDEVNKLATKDNRHVFYHGIPELILPWTMMDKPEDWVDLPKGSIVVIDECQSTFRPRANGAAVPRHVAEFETHRHKGLDFFLITQHPMLLDGNVRRLTGRHFHVNRFYGFQKSTIHEFPQVRENVDKNIKGSMARHFVYPKEVFNWYKSADLHTVKKRIPLRLILIVILPLLILFLLYYGYQSLKSIDKTSPLPSSNVSAGDKTEKPKAVTYASYNQEYLAVRTPAVQGVPQSAEIYKEVTKPITAPFAAACISMGSRCKCYSQQGTPLDVEPNLCKQLVAGGQFLDFDTSPRSQRPDGIIKGEALDADKAPSREL
jgi:hypothetical protein